MKSSNRTVPAVELADQPVTSAVEADLATGPASAFAGLRRALGSLREAGADFGALPERYPAEWAVLAGEGQGMARLAGLALSASERRLHRESEQTFRVMAVAALALCRGTSDLDTPLLLRGLGRTDLASLQGLIRAAECGAATGRGRFCVTLADATEIEPTAPAADFRAERSRYLRLLGLDIGPDGFRTGTATSVTHPAGSTGSPGQDTTTFLTALSPHVHPRERVAAALAYSRLSFYTGNWEGMAIVAGACLPVADQLTSSDVAWLSGGKSPAGTDEDNHAIEFEPALLRHRDDIRGFLLKVIGIQAAFRGRPDDAIFYFRAIRDAEGPLSAETRAQSHLYAALTLTKRKQRLAEAVAELEAGFAAVPGRRGEPASQRRERGWLHNLRGLTLFAERDMVAALEQEKAALDCIDGLYDASSVHLRVNLVSNISVLQESAGKLQQARATWERFRDSVFEQDAKFVKHHAYRAGGLRIKAGDEAGGVAELGESLRRCVELADDFHECEIAVELGTLLLRRGDAAAAARHYDQGAAAATRLGDPYRMAVAEIGRAAAARPRRAPATDVLGPASACLVQPERMHALIEGCQSGADLLTLLPSPRTKLNRPFDLVAR
jgi:tetratricopeptide (TPR) repeat protein